MATKRIYGIQQIGVGVEDVEKAFQWYATRLGADVCVFDDDGEATYMAPYMGGKPRKKRAILAMNMNGGAGYELWQYTNRKPQPPKEPIVLGDYGIHHIFVKCYDIMKEYERLKSMGENIYSSILTEPDGKKAFYLKDPFGNIIKIKDFDNWYKKRKSSLGGIFGCCIGVSDIESAMKLYRDQLGYTITIFDEVGKFEDFAHLPNGNHSFRRVLLTHHEEDRVGGFNRLLGKTEIELVQDLDTKGKKIFENRYWGDAGYIHLCFDVHNMQAFTQDLEQAGFPFKVLSAASFEMGEANGQWGYIEDPDGFLVEFVETHKVPILHKWGLIIDLTKRNPNKPLPSWLLNAMALKRKKFKA